MTKHVLRLASLAAATAAAAAVASGSAGAATTAPAQATTSCTLVSVSVGATDVDAAGQVAVHLDPIGANVTLEGLVGTLVCGLI